MLLDFVYDRLKMKKNRQHFNEFMINFHDFRHEKKDENSISKFVKNLKQKFDFLYFDEFQVTNIVDAMILGKLFENMFKEDLKIILTSNIKISELYKDGLQRDQFKPFIKIMEEKSIEHKLEIEDDYRKAKENQKQRFFSPLKAPAWSKGPQSMFVPVITPVTLIPSEPLTTKLYIIGSVST